MRWRGDILVARHSAFAHQQPQQGQGQPYPAVGNAWSGFLLALFKTNGRMLHCIRWQIMHLTGSYSLRVFEISTSHV
ncbi:hypothetical protein V6N11_066866 [Hibiscus sabdariffa]|uniref:Uncharacterized protein n=1 Tax=Hibiscus sabdariffa TaxID=183260 RepID=A0ABR2SPE8_9ROSI